MGKSRAMRLAEAMAKQNDMARRLEREKNKRMHIAISEPENIIDRHISADTANSFFSELRYNSLKRKNIHSWIKESGKEWVRDCLLFDYLYSFGLISVPQKFPMEHFEYLDNILLIIKNFWPELGLDFEHEKNKFIVRNQDKLVRFKLKDTILDSAVKYLEQHVERNKLDKEVIQLLSEYYKKTKTSYEAVLNKMSLLINTEHLEDALTCAKELIKSDPERSDGHYFIGKIYAKLKMNKNAIKAFTIANTLNPNNNEIIINLAEVLRDEGQFNLAITFYEKLLKSAMKDEVFFKLADIHVAARNYSQALKIYNEQYQKTANPEILYKIGDIYILTEDYTQALKIYSIMKNNKLQGLAEKLFKNIIEILEKQENWNACIKSYQVALNIEPRNAANLFSLGISYLKISDMVNAIKTYKSLQQIDHSQAEMLFKRIYS